MEKCGTSGGGLVFNATLLLNSILSLSYGDANTKSLEYRLSFSTPGLVTVPGDKGGGKKKKGKKQP